MIHILYTHTKQFEDSECFERAMALVSEKRKEKINQLKNPSAVRLSLAAGVLFYEILKENGYLHLQNEVKYNKYGKPFLEGIDFHFNFSHSGEYAICAYGDIQIGIDLQKIKTEIPKRTEKILSKEEEQFLLQCKNPVQSFYQLWAMKESVAKWDGRGLGISFSKLSFVEEGQLVDMFCFDKKNIYLKNFLFSDYAISLCMERKEETITIKEWEGRF